MLAWVEDDRGRDRRHSMHSLILFRHGKSDWDATYSRDHDRPLATRGRDAARCMGKLLRQAGQVPEIAISSSALRARETLQHAVRAGKWSCEIRTESALYDAHPSEVLTWITTLEIQARQLLLVGHEPTWSGLAGELIGEAGLRVPTATMLRIDFDVSAWSQVRRGRGTLRWLLPPKIVCTAGDDG